MSNMTKPRWRSTLVNCNHINEENVSWTMFYYVLLWLLALLFLSPFPRGRISFWMDLMKNAFTMLPTWTPLYSSMRSMACIPAWKTFGSWLDSLPQKCGALSPVCRATSFDFENISQWTLFMFKQHCHTLASSVSSRCFTYILESLFSQELANPLGLVKRTVCQRHH